MNLEVNIDVYENVWTLVTLVLDCFINLFFMNEIDAYFYWVKSVSKVYFDYKFNHPNLGID